MWVDTLAESHPISTLSYCFRNKKPLSILAKHIIILDTAIPDNYFAGRCDKVLNSEMYELLSNIFWKKIS